METDQHYLGRAIRLAMNGRGRVEPNPMVGCVIVRPDGRVIGEGFHEQFGGPHAEPNALAACARAGESPAGATAYVTLEPCCHTNKKTPPCTPRLIEAKLARVVVGCLDPNPQVNGQGIAMLRAAGIEVTAPVLEAQAKQLIAPFIATTRLSRPYVTLKWAESADGKVAGPGGRRTQISNPQSMALVHDLRRRSDAILVGIGTVLCDDPLLTARGAAPARPLLRVVLDANVKLPPKSRLVRTAAETPVWAFCSTAAVANDPLLANRAAELQIQGVIVRPVAASQGRLSLPAVLAELQQAGVTNLSVEPGPTLASSFFRDNLADRLWVFRSPSRIGDETAPAAAPVPGRYIRTGEIELAGDRLTEYLNPTSAAFFAPVPSADMLLAGRG
jgi:diaminohydroxyphosphoribosylaminopyrimidine deaminase / 5-amino-6-(5-phosphoribosylamino)uracil reductase